MCDIQLSLLLCSRGVREEYQLAPIFILFAGNRLDMDQYNYTLGFPGRGFVKPVPSGDGPDKYVNNVVKSEKWVVKSKGNCHGNTRNYFL
jgi:hypothetical protein